MKLLKLLSVTAIACSLSACIMSPKGETENGGHSRPAHNSHHRVDPNYDRAIESRSGDARLNASVGHVDPGFSRHPADNNTNIDPGFSRQPANSKNIDHGFSRDPAAKNDNVDTGYNKGQAHLKPGETVNQ